MNRAFQLIPNAIKYQRNVTPTFLPLIQYQPLNNAQHQNVNIAYRHQQPTVYDINNNTSTPAVGTLTTYPGGCFFEENNGYNQNTANIPIRSPINDINSGIPPQNAINYVIATVPTITPIPLIQSQQQQPNGYNMQQTAVLPQNTNTQQSESNRGDINIIEHKNNDKPNLPPKPPPPDVHSDNLQEIFGRFREEMDIIINKKMDKKMNDKMDIDKKCDISKIDVYQVLHYIISHHPACNRQKISNAFGISKQQTTECMNILFNEKYLDYKGHLNKYYLRKEYKPKYLNQNKNEFLISLESKYGPFYQQRETQKLNKNEQIIARDNRKRKRDQMKAETERNIGPSRKRRKLGSIQPNDTQQIAMKPMNDDNDNSIEISESDQEDIDVLNKNDKKEKSPDIYDMMQRLNKVKNENVFDPDNNHNNPQSKKRPHGLHYHTTTVKEKRRIIRGIEKLVGSHSTHDVRYCCKQIAEKRHENSVQCYKYERYYKNRANYQNKIVVQTRRNKHGSGRKQCWLRKQLFAEVTTLFDFFRYECGIQVYAYDIADFFIKAAKKLHFNRYQDHRSYPDALMWIKQNHAKYYSINSLMKYKPEYIAAKVGHHQEIIMKIINDNNIKISNIWNLDESRFWFDFCIRKITLSYKGRNSQVFWIPNDKDTTTFIGIWNWYHVFGFALTTDGYDKDIGIEFIPKCVNGLKLWWIRCPSDWINEWIYQLLLLFAFRLKRSVIERINIDNLNKREWFLYVDDCATGHKSNEYWMHQFFKILHGKYHRVAARITAYSQVADHAQCNGQLKSKVRRKGRNLMRRRIIEGIANKTEKIKVISKVTWNDMDKVIGSALDDMNTANGLKKIQKAFKNKYDETCYDTKLSEQIKIYNELKKTENEESLFPEKQQYYENKKNIKYANIDDSLLIYKHPEKAHKCGCNWRYSDKYKKSRINEHNKTCPINSEYGVVPAYEPLNDGEELLEFEGYKQRLDEHKCIFDLIGRKVEFTQNEATDIKATIIDDLGYGKIRLKVGENNYSECKLKDLHYHHTPEIWRG